PPPPSPLFPYTTLFRSQSRLHTQPSGPVNVRKISPVNCAVMAIVASFQTSQPPVFSCVHSPITAPVGESLRTCILRPATVAALLDRKSTRLNSSHVKIS